MYLRRSKSHKIVRVEKLQLSSYILCPRKKTSFIHYGERQSLRCHNNALNVRRSDLPHILSTHEYLLLSPQSCRRPGDLARCVSPTLFRRYGLRGCAPPELRAGALSPPPPPFALRLAGLYGWLVRWREPPHVPVAIATPRPAFGCVPARSEIRNPARGTLPPSLPRSSVHNGHSQPSPGSRTSPYSTSLAPAVGKAKLYPGRDPSASVRHSRRPPPKPPALTLPSTLCICT